MYQPPKYRRVLLKLSGEILAAGKGFGIDRDILGKLVDEISEVHELGIELGIVIGGGNIFRGQIESKRFGIDRWRQSRQSLPGDSCLSGASSCG